ncbi:MAG: hypothetical protein HC904_03220 [Blastochloris sp.]|nr:hypothetical protein [Blastochloris sp.]
MTKLNFFKPRLGLSCRFSHLLDKGGQGLILNVERFQGGLGHAAEDDITTQLMQSPGAETAHGKGKEQHAQTDSDHEASDIGTAIGGGTFGWKRLRLSGHGLINREVRGKARDGREKDSRGRFL